MTLYICPFISFHHSTAYTESIHYSEKLRHKWIEMNADECFAANAINQMKVIHWIQKIRTIQMNGTKWIQELIRMNSGWISRNEKQKEPNKFINWAVSIMGYSSNKNVRLFWLLFWQIQGAGHTFYGWACLCGKRPPSHATTHKHGLIRTHLALEKGGDFLLEVFHRWCVGNVNVTSTDAILMQRVSRWQPPSIEQTTTQWPCTPPANSQRTRLLL